MEDTINLWFYTRQNLRQEHFAQRILQLLFSADEVLAPEYVSVGDGWKTINAEDIDQLARWWPKQINIALERRSSFGVSVTISMGRASSRGYSSFSSWLTTQYLQLPNGLPNFLNYSIALYDLLHPSYGNIHPTKDALAMATVYDPRYGKTIVPTDLEKGLPAVYWGNFFGPEYVSLIGKSTLQRLSSAKTLELSDEGVLVLTTDTPLEIDHTLQGQIKSEIGQEFFYRWGHASSARTP